MCGIAGIWHFNQQKVEIETLKKFTDSMTHRGPDGAGYELFENETLGLGHRRLAILDLTEAGKQPMSIDNERYWITYNGEVYNFIEIREELKTFGYTFKSETDTEVILYAFKHWGTACLDKFNGEWAIAIWDNEKKELFIARDRFGIKPLYYTSNNEFFAFASEVLAFKFLAGFKYSLNEEMVNIQTKDNYILDGKGYTIFNDIYSILPGHYCNINIQNKAVIQQRWYDIRTKIETSSLTYNEQVQKLKSLLFDAVKIRLRSDVTIGCALSGGLDSSSIYGVLSSLKNENVILNRLPENWNTAYVQTFPNTEVDEKKYAEKVVSYCTGNVEYLVHNNENLFQNIEETTYHSQRISSTPIVSITDIYKNMKQKGVSVSIDGHGVDEMLFGYLGNVYDLLEINLKNGNRNSSKEIINVLANLYPIKDALSIEKKLNKDLELNFKLVNRIKRFVKKIINFNSVSKKIFVLESKSNYAYNFSENDILKLEFFEKTLPTLLVTFDISAMYSSVESRMPFMDHRIVEFLFSLPEQSKIGDGKTKRILRDAMDGLIPNEIRDRTYKIGISAPLNHWMNNELKAVITEKYKTNKNFSSLILKLESEDLDAENSCQLWRILNQDLLKVG